MDEKTLYTVEDVAALTGLTTRTIRNYLKSGALHGRKLGAQWRFTREEVEALFSGPEDDPVRSFLQAAHAAPAACAIVDLPALDEHALSALLARVRERLNAYAEPPAFTYSRTGDTVRLTLSGDLKKVARLLRLLRKDEQEV